MITAQMLKDLPLGEYLLEGNYHSLALTKSQEGEPLTVCIFKLETTKDFILIHYFPYKDKFSSLFIIGDVRMHFDVDIESVFANIHSIKPI